jgi:S1-C subfamily serine protease
MKYKDWLAMAVVLLLALAYNAAFAQPETTITACVESATRHSAKPSLVQAIARNQPAVVSVVVLRPRRDPFEELDGRASFQSLAGLPLAQGNQPARVGASLERSFSSGFILHADGRVLTSAHAVHDAHEVRASSRVTGSLR